MLSNEKAYPSPPDRIYSGNKGYGEINKFAMHKYMLIQHLFQILEVMIKLVNRMISFKRDNRLDVSVDVEPGFVQVPLHEINRPENYTTATIAAHAYKCTVSLSIQNSLLQVLTFHSVLKQVIKKNAHNRRLLSNRVAFLQKSVRLILMACL